MERFVSLAEDSVNIKIVIIAMDDRFNQDKDEAITNTDGLHSDEFEKKHILPIFCGSSNQFANDCDVFDFCNDDGDVW